MPSLRQTIALLKTDIVSTGFTIKQLDHESVSIYTSDLETFEKAKTLLKAKNLSSDSTANDLTAIKSLAYQRIKWELLRKKEIYQCRKCQRLGHTSSNCGLKYRCVKCKNDHKPGECGIAKESVNKSALYRVNCEEYGHPASYRGCPFIKFSSSIKNDIKYRNTKHIDGKITKVSKAATGIIEPPTRSNPPRSYANAVIE
ncbi:hypothetical protein TSAR_009039 [Trichomalopsis sarcophagae]|uniref:CCHC-type domain-containing protein n=1 Tax=Trichomalopsis sarcophagae TaxID=543379 RepID=A0A232ED40_9HYME|nr:hypothetical protein TSAR_009039 [Trichomalopsis sarcophagae]